jgi:hypothetical protein
VEQTRKRLTTTEAATTATAANQFVANENKDIGEAARNPTKAHEILHQNAP